MHAVSFGLRSPIPDPESMRLPDTLGACVRTPRKCAHAMALAGLDQLWVGDIAYISLLTEFASEWPVLLVPSP